MADYTRPDRKSLNQLLKNYDLGLAEQITPLDGGQANSSFKIITHHGSYTLSICDEKNELEIDRLIRVLDWLKKSDFPTTRVITTKGGLSFVSYMEKPVYVKTFIPGEVISDLSVQMCFQVGVAMGRLHRLELPTRLRVDLSAHSTFATSTFDDFLNQGVAHPYSDWLEKKRAHLHSALDPAMDKSLIHGDLFWDNLIFSEGQLKALLDFEEACFFYRLFDLAMGIIGCCSHNGDFLRAQARGFISGYQTICPLTTTEKAQLKIFIEYAGMVASLWRFRQYNLINPNPDKMNSYLTLSDLVDQAHNMNTACFVNEFINNAK